MYTWTQTLEELQVYIPVETGLKGKECKISMTPDSLEVNIRGQLLFKGKLHKKINVNPSQYPIERRQSMDPRDPRRPEGADSDPEQVEDRVDLVGLRRRGPSQNRHPEDQPGAFPAI